MRLVTNSVAPNKVKETEFGWRIEDVPFVKPMPLAGGYVPESSIKETANGWNGTPPTLNHPRDETGQPIAANKKPELQLGRIENADYDGEFVRGDIVVNEADLVRLGGEALDIRDALENGDPINVSSQYRGENLPAGTYDGEFRSNVEKIVEPDSVALLPNKPAQCSVEDGCGINPQMVANAGVSITATSDDAVSPEGGQAEAGGDTQTMEANKEVDGIAYDGVASGNLDESEIPNDDYEAHYVFDADTKSESGFPLVDAEGNLRAGNVASAFRFRDDAPDTEKLVDVLEAVNDEFEEPPIDPENFADMESNSAFGRIKSFLGITDETTGAESPADTATDADEPDTMDRETYIEEITANSPLTEESLAERCDDGLEAIHSDVMEVNDDDTEDTTDVTESEEDVVELTENDLRDMISEEVEQVTANQQTASEKEELASEIVANSAEYEDTETVLEDYPTTAALETKKEDVAPDAGAGFPARGATTANASQSVDDYPDMDFGGD